MEGQELRDGRARVQTHLIAPLEGQGMQRGTRDTVAGHAAFLDKLRNRLAYMTAPNLTALAEIVANMAGGKHRDRWPAEVAVMNAARRLQVPPASESRMVRTWLQSAAGLRALDGDYHVEAFFWMKRAGNVPNDFVVTELRREAEARRAELTRLRAGFRDGRVTASEYRAVEDYDAAQERVRGIIEERKGQAA